MPTRGESSIGLRLEDEFAHNVGVIAFDPIPVVSGYSKIVQLSFGEANNLVGANVADILRRIYSWRRAIIDLISFESWPGPHFEDNILGNPVEL